MEIKKERHCNEKGGKVECRIVRGMIWRREREKERKRNTGGGGGNQAALVERTDAKADTVPKDSVRKKGDDGHRI